MKKTVFELTERTAQINLPRRFADVHKITPGCAEMCEEPRLIKRFEAEADAVKELNKYETYIEYRTGAVDYVVVTEYYVEEIIFEVDEDGDEFLMESCGCRTTEWPNEVTFGSTQFIFNKFRNRYEIADDKK